MMGLTLAPVTGRLVADLVAGREPSHEIASLPPGSLSPFLGRRPSRAAAEPHDRVAVGAP